MIYFYRILWWTLLPIFSVLFKWARAVHFIRKPNSILPKWLSAIEVRIQSVRYPLMRSNPLWIHCASGEFENLRHFIRTLKETNPNIPLLLTFSSPTLGAWLTRNQHLPEVRAFDAFCPHPFDEKNRIQRFLNHFDPRALIISRTDLWPEALYQMRERSKPTFLAAATLGKGQKKTRLLFRSYVKWNLKLLSEIWAVSAVDAKNFAQLAPQTPCTILGEPRFDQAAHRVQNPSLAFAKTNSQWSSSPRFDVLFASTWPADETEILKTLPYITSSKIKIIWAPHEVHPAHIQYLKSILELNKIDYQLWSQFRPTETQAPQALLIDQVGVLGDLYAWTSVAFVGGSFKHQVHSILEPLAHANLVLVGPFHENSREAIDFKSVYYKNIPWVKSVRDGEELTQELQTRVNVEKSTLTAIANRLGSSQAMLEHLVKLRVLPL